MPRIAAIDYGLKRIGLAISDEKGRIALPLKLVLSGNNLRESVKNVLNALSLYEGQIEEIIVGLPLLLNGKRGEMAERAQFFAAALQKETRISVIMMDERLSTSQAERDLKKLSYSRKERVQIIDCASAAILLQTYLDKNYESP